MVQAWSPSGDMDVVLQTRIVLHAERMLQQVCNPPRGNASCQLESPCGGDEL
jgi:hypothetical protein